MSSIQEDIYYHGKVVCTINLGLEDRTLIEKLVRELNKYEHVSVEWNCGMEDSTVEIRTLSNIYLVKSFLPYCLNYVGLPVDKVSF
ncbi:hypothetical protein NVP1170O_060 [Vibrio phage 1.170.O._10N.261.52.C3]|nr:hypothetical protein NVP1170O_060 [Vibrio phage 1.170.O._10N.261.52.C3]